MYMYWISKNAIEGLFQTLCVAVASSICMEHWNSKRKITDVTGDA